MCIRRIASPLIFLAALTFLCLDDARAFSAQDLFEDCTTTRDDPVYYQNQAFCSGYINGSWDWLRFTGLVFDGHKIDAPEDLAVRSSRCIPEGVTAGQLKDVYVKYVRDNPQIQHKPAWSAFAEAIKNAFC